MSFFFYISDIMPAFTGFLEPELYPAPDTANKIPAQPFYMAEPGILKASISDDKYSGLRVYCFGKRITKRFL